MASHKSSCFRANQSTIITNFMTWTMFSSNYFFISCHWIKNWRFLCFWKQTTNQLHFEVIITIGWDINMVDKTRESDRSNILPSIGGQEMILSKPKYYSPIPIRSLLCTWQDAEVNGWLCECVLLFCVANANYGMSIILFENFVACVCSKLYRHD